MIIGGVVDGSGMISEDVMNDKLEGAEGITVII